MVMQVWGLRPRGSVWARMARDASWRDGVQAELSHLLCLLPSSFPEVAPECSHTHVREDVGQRATPHAPLPVTIHEGFGRCWLRNWSRPVIPRRPCWSCSKASSLERNLCLVLNSSPHDAWPRPHGEYRPPSRSYGRGRAQIPLPQLGVLGWNVYSFWNRAPKKLSCGTLGEVGFYDRLKEEAWRRKESAVKIFWVLGTLHVTDSQVPFEPANKIGFWQLTEDIHFFTEKQGAIKGMRSYEEIKSIFLPSWPEGEKKHKEKKILSQFLGKKDITSISAFTDSPIDKGQQPVCEKRFSSKLFESLL